MRYGTQGKTDDGKKLYCHMLNSTLVATERALCCVIENYQTKCGIKVPDVLQEYMGGVSFIPFVSEMPKPKKGPAPPQYVPTPAQIAEMDEGKMELSEYMKGVLPTLNEALNSLAKDRPDEPISALAELLAAAAKGAATTSAAASGLPTPPPSGATMSAEEWKKKEAEELKAKQEAERKKAIEKDKLEAENIAKMQALEAQGKKVAGGMHKFDASEVDVHGGNATADDFLDAFGF